MPPLPLPLRVAVACAGLVALAGGCDVQADPSFRGEPLARLGGTIMSSIDDPPGDLRAVLGWSNTAAPGGDLFRLDEAIVTTEFPARFRFELYEPPADETLNDYTQGGARPDEVRIGVAHIAAWPASYEVVEDDDDGPEVFGLAEHQLLVYVERDVQPGTRSADLLGGALEAGFHVMDVIDMADPACGDEYFDCMRPSPADLDSEIEIRIDRADQLDIPDWT